MARVRKGCSRLCRIRQYTELSLRTRSQNISVCSSILIVEDRLVLSASKIDEVLGTGLYLLSFYFIFVTHYSFLYLSIDLSYLY